MDQLDQADIQGLLARGYGPLRAATFLLLGIDDPAAACRWLGTLAPQVTTVASEPADTAVNVAFTATGLQHLGMPADVLGGFSFEFRAGMTTPNQRRALADFGDDAPEHWLWGGPDTRAIDAILLLYAKDDATLAPLVREQTQALAATGLSVIRELPTSDYGDREPFGFRDGLSQPSPDGLGKPAPAADTIAPGEFVLGHKNEYGLLTERPLVEASTAATVLPEDTEGSGKRDVGRNGSYLVLRQLEQNVPGFWRTLEQRAAHADGSPDAEQRTAIAAKMVGRWPGGAPLALSPERDDPALANSNDFAYHHADAAGMACPIGAHVRRANPRDSLDPDPGSERSIAINKHHRILRRGRAYGTPISVEDALAGNDPGGERGLYFACLNANIARQFQFVQHTWINNAHFDGLYDDVDPFTGPRGSAGSIFTIPADPVRKRLTGLPAFVRTRGGAYFFLPGVNAIRYLAAVGSVK
ncbi:hypothetical protein AYO38_04380 [bacterium SCGC AG-212-C10]|nr:hypothetical protein AYO38_04380 [bacterium SCGC AG-212-C10]